MGYYLRDDLPRNSHFWHVGLLDIALSEYPDKSHNFRNFIFTTSSLSYSIRESSSPYASPVVVVKKKDNTNYVCVDWLNKLTVFYPEPMWTAKHLFQKLSGDKFNSKIDLSKGYWKITIPEEDILKTAFVTPDGSYEFLKMPFGMINSAATAMKKLIEDLDDVDFYWDYILVHTHKWEEHIRTLRELFSRLVQAGLTIRPTKCLFGVNSVDFLGHRLEQGMIGLHQDNVEKIKDALRPSTKKQCGHLWV